VNAIALRPYLDADLPTLASIARDAIEEIAVEDYTEAQCAAWADALEDDIVPRLEKALTLVATIEGTPVGFASLVDNTKIDLLYVDPRVARTGVATTLLDALEKLATARGAKEVTADASDTAKPLFDARSYVASRRNTVTLGDEWLANTSMKKILGPKQ
jgi:putative acetyltransferase